MQDSISPTPMNLSRDPERHANTHVSQLGRTPAVATVQVQRCERQKATVDVFVGEFRIIKPADVVSARRPLL
jgi:hypothetical protein